MKPESHMPECNYSSQIAAYYDRQLPMAAQQAISAHLPNCAPCQAQLQWLRQLSQQLAGAAAPPAPADFMYRLHARIDGEGERTLLRTAYSLLSLAACLLLAITLWMQRPGQAAAESTLAWETTAANPQSDTTQEIALAQWIVQDLSGGKAHE